MNEIDAFFVDFALILISGDEIFIVMVCAEGQEEQQVLQFHMYSVDEGNGCLLNEVNAIPGVCTP